MSREGRTPEATTAIEIGTVVIRAKNRGMIRSHRRTTSDEGCV